LIYVPLIYDLFASMAAATAQLFRREPGGGAHAEVF
jgi:hypothetical protein